MRRAALRAPARVGDGHWRAARWSWLSRTRSGRNRTQPHSSGTLSPHKFVRLGKFRIAGLREVSDCVKFWIAGLRWRADIHQFVRTSTEIRMNLLYSVFLYIQKRGLQLRKAVFKCGQSQQYPAFLPGTYTTKLGK